MQGVGLCRSAECDGRRRAVFTCLGPDLTDQAVMLHGVPKVTALFVHGALKSV